MTFQIKKCFNGRLLLAGMFWLAFAGMAAAALPSYVNNSIVSYTIPPQVMPTIDATNFINNNTFNLTFTAPAQGQNIELFEPDDVVNYTNIGLMTANSSFLVNNDGLIFNFNLGCGYLFDNYSVATGLHSMAGSFYNSGNIRADSFQDLGTNFLFVLGLGKCVINASNIVNPGTIDLGFDSLLQMTGQDVDLTRGTLIEENLNALDALLGGFLFQNVGLNSLDYGVGTDTNADWDPSVDLQPTFAISSEFNSLLFPAPGFNQMLVNPATPYYFENDTFDTNNVVVYRLIRAVWLNDDPGSNVTASVYFGGNPIPYLGPGFTTVGWAAPYFDPTTGQWATNYLYLNDFYLRGANTNNPIINGVPANFTFTELNNTPAVFGVAPAAPAFPLIQPPGVVTNNYSYVDVQLITTSQGTNASLANPSGALSNITSRIEIAANNSLDLSLSSISGMNFLSLTSTNQFNGATGARILSPYSDIKLGVTNGTMTFSNVLEPNLPSWGGTCQAWSSDWFTFTTNEVFVVDTNGVITATNFITETNEYRVMLINADLNPTTPAWVQHLLLHATNDLVVSDALNVFGKFSIDAENLTLTLNDSNIGSPDGELNLQDSTNFWETSAPNLRNVTNNGAIRLSNYQQFGSPVPESFTNITITSGSTAMTASGMLSAIGNVALNDSVTIGTNKYIFVLSFSKRGVANEVKIGSTIGSSLFNLISAINRAPGAGTLYSSRTVTNRQVFASGLQNTNRAFTVIADSFGAAANSIVTTTTSKKLLWSNATLAGGATASAPETNVQVTTTGGRYVSFINDGVLTDQGTLAYVDNFVNSGTILNDIGSFTLSSLTTTMTNDTTNVIFSAGGDVNITADSLIISNTLLFAGRSLTLTATNLLTDGGASSSNIWVVGINSVGYGISVPVKPPVGDLLGTTITNYAPANRNVVNVWSGNDLGSTAAGFTNNLSVGKLVLDALGPPPATIFTFRGSGNANALYVDDLQLLDEATNQDVGNNFTALNIETNIVIYYAQAEMDGQSIAQKMNGKNGDRLRWIQNYTNVFNSALVKPVNNSPNLASSKTVDSNGNGIPNASDPTPFFTNSQVNLHTGRVTNNTIPVIWNSIPASTNYLYRSTNGASGPFNQLVTSFVSPPQVPPVGGWPITNIVYDPIVAPMQFYSVIVIPNSAQFYGQ
jgi:hypothetical protein